MIFTRPIARSPVKFFRRPGDPAAEAEQLVEQGIAFSKQNRSADAVAAFSRAEAALAQAPDDRVLALARWRLSMELMLMREPEKAVAAGRNALGNSRAVLAAGGDDDTAAEIAVVFTDVAEVLTGAGYPDEGDAVRAEAEQAFRDSTHPALRRARGTLMHNIAAARWRAIGAPGMTTDTIREPLTDMLGWAARAVQVRREFRDAGDPISWYELANSLRLLAQGSAMAGKLDQMADAVAEALPQVQPLTPGPAVDQLRGELGVLVQFLERRAPGKLSERGISG
jgi:tetratricopeptide (TPR) repeat protein